MNQIRRNLAAVILTLLVFSSVMLCCACGNSEKQLIDSSEDELITEMISAYGSYGDKAAGDISLRQKVLEEKNPVVAAKWKNIMSLWKYSNDELVIHYDVLPDGLPETDEFCIVVLGYQLNADGTMRDELVGRLEVAKASAEKYPNAFVVCTGGHTAYECSEASEAGRMADWLTENGVSPERIIVEDNSLTTAQNAYLSLDILSANYPQVKELAVITSDYHITTGHMLLGAEAILRADEAGEEEYEVISNAAYKAPSGSLSSIFQASALSELKKHAKKK